MNLFRIVFRIILWLFLMFWFSETLLTDMFREKNKYPPVERHLFVIRQMVTILAYTAINFLVIFGLR